jgi:N utilization substance protein B
MGRRRKARESALQILFQSEFDSSTPDVILQQFWQDRKASPEERRYCEQLVKGIRTHRTRIDAVIQSVSENWRVARMLMVDRNILRIAVYELFWGERLAPGIVINEAVEIAKKFSGDRSATFINGILDALRLRSDAVMKSVKENEHA